MKKCSTCGEEKSLEEFNKNKTKKGGLSNQCRACRKQYRKANREKIAEQKKQYYQNNREVFRLQDQRRRARKANAAGHCTREQLRARFEYYGNRCVYCGSEENLQVEHLIPISKGGSNWPANLAPACESCNKSKHARKTFVEFKAEKFQSK